MVLFHINFVIDICMYCFRCNLNRLLFINGSSSILFCAWYCVRRRYLNDLILNLFSCNENLIYYFIEVIVLIVNIIVFLEINLSHGKLFVFLFLSSSRGLVAALGEHWSLSLVQALYRCVSRHWSFVWSDISYWSIFDIHHIFIAASCKFWDILRVKCNDSIIDDLLQLEYLQPKFYIRLNELNYLP